jgi:class 3 adenylate cyclase
MVLFNDPVPVANPGERAACMALEMQAAFAGMSAGWRKEGIELGLGIGIAQGYATIGAIGFEGRWDYGAVGSVTNLAARLCAEAKAGQILTHQKVAARLEMSIAAVPAGSLTLKGFAQPVPAFSVEGVLQQAKNAA